MTRASFALLVLFAVGCSDSSEATLPVGDRTPDAADAHGGSGAGGQGGQGGSPDGSAHSGGRSTTLDAGSDTRDSSDRDADLADAPTNEASTEGGDVVSPRSGPGVLVAYDIQSTEKALHVLDPETGRSLSSEPFGIVRAIAHDGAPEPDDRWYIFEQEGTADQGVTLHVRRLDAAKGAFHELGSMSGAPMPIGRPVTFGTNGNSFVAYLSDGLSGSSSKAEAAVTVLNTTDATAVKRVSVSGTFPAASRLGLVADQGSLALVTLQIPPCPQGSAGTPECSVSLVSITVGGSGATAGAAVVVGHAGPEGNVDFAVAPSRHSVIIGSPALATPKTPTCTSTSRTIGSVRAFSFAGAAAGDPVTIPIEAARFSGAAFDACNDVMFLTAHADDVAVWAVPLGAGTVPSKLCAGSMGGPLFYEASTTTLFRALPTGAVEAFRVDATGRSPVLTPRTLTDLPAGFRAGALAASTRTGCF